VDVDDYLDWVDPGMTGTRGRLRPAFDVDDRFDSAQWSGSDAVQPPSWEWRSYLRGGAEVARMLLCFEYRSHRSDSLSAALLLSNFEVRNDRLGEGIGRTIVAGLVREGSGHEMYLGPTDQSIGFWRKMGWEVCGCRTRGCPDLMMRLAGREH
jgi:hypothetical protein